MSRRLLAFLLAAATGCVLTTDFDAFTTPSSGNAPDGNLPAESGAVDHPDSGTTVIGGDDAGTDSGPESDLMFRDDFNRPDGPLGNGWIEGNPGRYKIANDYIPVNGAGFDFEHDYLYRPAPSELDIEVSIEFTPHALPPQYPQVHVRSNPAKGQCYGVGVPAANDTFFWGRCLPNDFTQLGSTTLSEALILGVTYRLRLAVSGTNPVHLAMALERGDNGTFTTIGSATADDSAPERVTVSGMFGVAANATPNWDYDNFIAMKLPKP